MLLCDNCELRTECGRDLANSLIEEYIDWRLDTEQKRITGLPVDENDVMAKTEVTKAKLNDPKTFMASMACYGHIMLDECELWDYSAEQRIIRKKPAA